jgi:hypothetical protein
MKNLVIYSLVLLGLQSANAIELTHKNYTFNALRKQAWMPQSTPLMFISEIDIRREVNTFSSNSGMMVLNAMAKVTSEYDETSTAYEMTPFYTAANSRKHVISNFAIPNTPFLLSFGFDSGSRSEKITISKTYFVGFSAYQKLDASSILIFTAGGWQRERIAEQPCVDEYDREYWCPNLTAWSDRKPLTSKPLRFAEVRYERRF